MVGILGRKLGMTQIFDEKGTRVPVTVIEAGPCRVLQVKTIEKDGYLAVQLGFDEKKAKNTTLPLIGHFHKAGTTPKRFVRELRCDEPPQVKVGDEVKVTVLEGTRWVDVTGISKGKGFQGGVKRWHFHGLGASHGCSKRHRAPGSLGRACSISKGVPKGKRMAGHMGDRQVTVQGLAVVRIDPERNLLLIRGAVPGANGGFLVIRKGLRDYREAAKAARKAAAGIA
ncbi:MAG: 50S ribosomal protein L3 [Planctomycetota bacterium]|nr:50S ribosomal protein L3 [Planctomycetota bacterium]